MTAKAKDPAMYESNFDRAPADLYPTPPDLAHALTIDPLRPLIEGAEVWEPCQGTRALWPALTAAGAASIVGSDLVDYGWPDAAPTDFLDVLFPHARTIVTNPPYSADFPRLMAERACEWIDKGKADSLVMLCRCDWDLAKGRKGVLSHPAYLGAVRMCWRPYWTENRTHSPRHSYQWLVWSASALPNPVRQWHHYRPSDADLVSLA